MCKEYQHDLTVPFRRQQCFDSCGVFFLAVLWRQNVRRDVYNRGVTDDRRVQSGRRAELGIVGTGA